MEKENRTAVLLYGFLRTAEITSQSLMNNIIESCNADIFYFGPNASDNPKNIHNGILDSSGFIKINPKNDALEITGGVAERLSSLYGDKLISFELHDKVFDDFVAISSFIDKNQWLFSLNPARFISMFYNIQGVYSLMEKYEKSNDFKYEKVIITRPDLAFYSKFDLTNIHDGFVYIPDGEGFCPHTGNRNKGLTQVLPYRNKKTGKMVPSKTGFNDQVLVFTRLSSQPMANVMESVLQYMKEQVPLTPETLLYYHLVSNSGLKVRYTNKWPYEIVRSDDKAVVTVTDLMIMDIIDRYHPVVQNRIKKRPIKYFMKFGRIRFRAFKNRYFGWH